MYCLGFLAFEDLERCTRVSTSWRALAELVLKEQELRRDAHDFVLDLKQPDEAAGIAALPDDT